MEDVYQHLYSVAADIASSLVMAGGRRVRDEALGNDQERALHAVFGDATAAVLVEIARHNREDHDLPDRLGTEFKKFYQDRWVAETLVGFAISAEQPPLKGLERRYAAVGNDPGALPMDFGEAMRLLVYGIADRLRKEASRAGSPLNNLVQVSELGIIRTNLEELIREQKRYQETQGGAAERAGAPERDHERFEDYERGPERVEYDVLFAGFFLPSGPEGRLTTGGSSRALGARFAKTLRQELANHRLNTLGVQLAGVDLPVRLLDHRPPAGYLVRHDHESFSDVAERLAEHSLGVVWGTVDDGGQFQTLEIVVNPDRFYGGSLAPGGFSAVKRLADRENLASGPRIAFGARALAAMWAQSFSAELDLQGMHAESYRVASDSRRLLERALGDLGRELGPGERLAVEEQRRGLLPGIVRQEASSLWRGNDAKEAMGRLIDGLKAWPYGPLPGPGEFREYLESDYAFSLAEHVESFERFVADNYGDETAPRKDLTRQYRQRALAGLPPVDFELFSKWLGEAQGRSIDVEQEAERWLADLAAAYPEEPFVTACWGEARRVIAVSKYHATFGSPTAWRMDRAAEKFEEAYLMAPDIPYFAARTQALRFAAAAAFAHTDEGERRMDEAFGWWERAKPYYREHAPWMLEPGSLDKSERLGNWVAEQDRAENRGEGGG